MADGKPETMRFAVDSWAPEYGTSREEQLQESARPVDLSVEIPQDRWRPIAPEPVAQSKPVTFVDGVRRIDDRIWITDVDGIDRPGVCASVAAGAVRCVPRQRTGLPGQGHIEPGQAHIEKVMVERAVFSSSAQAAPIDLGRNGRYELREVSANTDEALYLAVHRHMTSLEQRMADELEEPGPVVFDGPLGPRNGASAVGYIKTQHVQYLEASEHQSVLASLKPGERTPVFHLGGDLANWSWYLRLPGPRAHSLSGIVRLELPGLGEAEDAATRADEISSLLPRYASAPHKDPRAPQNLYPIAGLERELRRRLGDARLIDRSLRRAAKLSAV